MGFFGVKRDVRFRASELEQLEKIIQDNPELETVSHAIRTAVIQFISSYEFKADKWEKAAAKLEQYKKDKIGKI